MRENRIILLMVIWLLTISIFAGFYLHSQNHAYKSHSTKQKAITRNTDFNTSGFDTIDLEFELPKGLTQSLEFDYYVGYVPQAEKREHALIGDLAKEGEADSTYTEWKDGAVWFWLNNTDSYSRWGIYTTYLKIKAVTSGRLHIYLHLETDSSLSAYNSAQNMSEVHIYFYNINTNDWDNVYDIGSQWYNYSITVNTDISYTSQYISTDGTLYVKVYAFGNLVSSGSASWSEFWIDSAWVVRDRLRTTVAVEHKTLENISAVLHYFSFDNFEYGSKIAFQKNDWTYYSIYPTATVTENSTHYIISDTVATTYTVYLYSFDSYNYPEESLSRIAIYNPKGELLPFDNFKVYKSTTLVAWADDNFRLTNNIEEDTMQNGYAESFRNISDWTLARTSDNTQFSGDGDIATLYTEYDGIGGPDQYHDYVYIQILLPLDEGINLQENPFIEIRWKLDCNVSTSYKGWVVPIVTDGSYTYQLWNYRMFYITTTDWRIDRGNIQQKVELAGYDTNIWKLRGFNIGFDLPSCSERTLYIDYIHVYGLTEYNTRKGNIDANTYIYKENGKLVIQNNFDQAGVQEYIGPEIYFAAPVSVYQYRYLAIKFGNVDVDAFDLVIKYGETYTRSGHKINIASNTTVIVDLQLWDITRDNGVSGFEFLLIDNAWGGLIPDYSGIKRMEIESIALISETSDFEPVLYPIFQSYKNSIEWFKIYNIFGDLLIDEPRLYSVYQDFVVNLVDWKFSNYAEDFIYIQLSRNGYSYSEWLAPREVAEYTLYPGDYELKIMYTDGRYSTSNLQIDGDSYWILKGDTIADVISNLAYVQSNISFVQSQNTWILSNQTIILGNVSINQAILNNVDANITINQALLYDTLANISINQAYLTAINANITIMNGTLNLINQTVWINQGQINTTLGIVNINNATLTNIDGNITIIYGLVSANNANITIINATLDRIEDEILRLFNHLQINLYNNLTGLGMDITRLKVYVNNTRITTPDYYTLAETANITVKDYFNRTVFYTVTDTNKTLDIGIPVGELSILNNNSYTLRVIISPNGTNITSTLFLKPQEMISLELILGNYTMEIYRVIYNTNTGEIQSFKKLDTITVNLNAQSQNLALDYEREYVPVDNGLLGSIFLAVIVGIVGIGIKEGWFVTKKAITGRDPDEPVWY